MATGRRPNTAGLGLEKVGIAVDEVGAIPVDGYSQTVDAVDLRGRRRDEPRHLTPIAIREGHAFADTVFGDTPDDGRSQRSSRPRFSRRRKSASSAAAKTRRAALYGEIDVYKTSFRPMRATLSGSDETA